eukprot:CAMPEP_0116139576 /NCGR_PEP_ID=MMETSP0329-20121206/13386_1 /TAXON_ID=697910 /ORGANISM="Pseudo-nitzschia arenysensis, Strain B593" /LENGTH=1831 /DNA_ID=CAMNT_0003634629 /DNA_START=36 /DNA_END=5531 /DNA_ORIENTATION=+
MGREKRKGRLNKTGDNAASTGAFIGFGAFANAGGAAATSSTSNPFESVANASSGNNNNNSNKTRLSPIYTGTDQTLLLLFPKIGQKRDATTKTKALQELVEFFQSESTLKKTKAEALSHFLYLFSTKLYYDNSQRVRAHAVKVSCVASEALPKAWKNLTATDTELHGMLLCARADLAAEVRSAAAAYSHANDERYLDAGMWKHAQRILSYNKPVDMHMDLFQKKGGDGGKAKAAKLSEAQQEELEERYERIVGTVIEGMRLHLLRTPSRLASTADPVSVKYLWKALASRKASLRRQTYSLLSTVCQLPGENNNNDDDIKTCLIDPDKMSKLLSQSLASEKESINIVMLLETLLAFCVSFFSTKKDRANAMAKHFAKPLTKLFKKGCHGASPATSWTPTLLPLVALLPSKGVDPTAIPPKIDLLTNAWEGQNHVVSNKDRWEVVSAVAETAAFLLAKEESNDNALDGDDDGDDDIDEDVAETFHKILAQCWIRSLQSYLAGSAGGAAFPAHRKLGRTLTKGWLQLDKASFGTSDDNKMPSIVYNIREWFWKEAVCVTILSKSTVTTNMTTLLVDLRRVRKLGTTSKSTNTTNLATLMLALKDKKNTILEPLWATAALSQKFKSLNSTNSAAWVPKRDIYELWIAILKVVPTAPETISVADNNGKDPLEVFVMNQLLQWMILHTSSRSDQCDKALALLDVELLHLLSLAIPNSFTKWWHPILREVLAGEPDLETLKACLQWLLTQGRGHSITDVVGGSTSGFSDFCVSVAQSAMNQEISLVGDDASDSESEASHHESGNDKTKQFLQACVGLESMPKALVGESVVNEWLDCACPKEDGLSIDTTRNPVLDTLVAMVRANKFSDKSKIGRVLLQSWRQGGRLWEDQCLQWLGKTETIDVRTYLIQSTSTESQNSMKEISLAALEIDDDLAWAWTERAYRLLRLCSSEEGVESPSLTIVGLGDISIWEESHVGYLKICLMRLIRHMEGASSRWQLFVNSKADTLELLVTILMSLSDGTEDPLKADLARRRKDSCAMLLSELEFSTFDSEIVQESIKCCISKLSNSLKATTSSPKHISRGVAVLSQLIESRFVPLRPNISTTSSQEKLNPDDVRVGDKIWYITKADNPLAQEQCILVKIHRDLPEEVYFTIQLDRDGVKQERQTLGARLRKTGPPEIIETASTANQSILSVDEVNAEEKRERERIVAPVVEQLINSIDETHAKSAYELYNVAISQCGLICGKGIGSLHYSVVQKLMKLQKQVTECLSTSDASNMIAPTLWRLALALGFGMNTPASEWSIPLIGSNATDTLTSLIEFDDDEEREDNSDIDSAMAVWLSICSPVCNDESLRTQSYSLLFDLASRLLEDSNESKHHYIALRAIEVGQAESHKSKEGESIIQEGEAEALAELTKAFAIRWESNGEDTSTLVSNPLFDSIMKASLNTRSSLMAIASRQCISALTEALYEPSKQYYATRILQSYAKTGRPLHANADDDDLINPATLDRIDEWAKDMLENEAEELEDDVASVAQWVCGEQMNDVESWHDDDDIDDEIACGRMLSWLSFLDIADTATGKDSANRISFTSYVSICKAVDAMLDLALIYANIGSERKVELDVVISMEDIIESAMPLSKLAARVIFRSVEVFPTLSKNWWDSTCPKYLTTTVREFVEKEVSPDILKDAIKSIQNASAFGDMSVQGGSITREVSATYVQDDFTLSVLVKLPLSFPFRRAEVDCSKTLGVPAHRWKRWSLQITQMLNNQGGTLKDALLLWKENVDKEFEGVEPCPICYSVLHVKSHKLPNLECNTCHNQFHTDCLYEWFKSSGKSACPICQQAWSGTRI